MSRFIDFRNPLTDVEREMILLGKEEQVRNYTTPQYLLGDGTVSFSPPSSNIFTNLLQKSARNSINLGLGAGAILNSGAGILSRQFYRVGNDTIPLYSKDGNAVLSDGSVKPVDELTGSDYFKALNPTVRTILEQNGITSNNFNSVRTIEEASERYNNIRRGIFLDQSIRRYNEVHPHWASVTGISNFVLDAVTDPINIVSFGLGGMSKGVVTTSLKEAGNTTLERSLVRISKNMADGDTFAQAAWKNPTDADYMAAHFVRSTKEGGFVTREVVDTTGESYMVTSRVIKSDGDRVVYEPTRITLRSEFVSDYAEAKARSEGRNASGSIVTDFKPIVEPNRLLTSPPSLPSVVISGSKRTGLTSRLEDAYRERFMLESSLDDFLTETTEEVGLELGIERIGKDISRVKDLEVRLNKVGKKIESLEKKVGKQLSKAYATRAALDREFEQFLKDGEDFVEVSLETGLAYLKQDNEFLKSLDRRYAGVNKTIARLEGVDSTNVKLPSVVDDVPTGFKQPGESIKEYNRRRSILAIRENSNNGIVKYEHPIKGPAQEPGLVLRQTDETMFRYNPNIVEGDIEPEVVRRVILASAGPLSRGAALTAAAGLGVAFDTSSQYAEYSYRVNDLGYEGQFKYDPLRGGMSILLQSALAGIGSMHLGKEPKMITNEDVVNYSPASLAGKRAFNKATKNPASEKAYASLIELDALNRAEKWSKAAYTHEEYLEIMDILEHAPIVEGPAHGPNELSAEDIGTLFSHAPTFEEARAYLLEAGPLMTGTKFNTIMESIVETRKLLRKAQETGDTAAEKKLRKKSKELEEQRRELTDTFEFREDTPGYEYIAIVDDVPPVDIYGTKDDRLYRLRNILALTSDDLPESTQGNITKATSSLFGYLAKLGSQGTAARNYQKMEKLGKNPIAQTVARMIGAIDSRIANDFFTTPDGKAVLTVEQNIALFSLKRTNFTNTYFRVMKKHGRARREEIGREVMQARAGVRKTEQLSDEAKELLPHFSSYYDEMAAIGSKNGSLKSKIDGYVNIQFKDGIDNSIFDLVATKLAKYWRTKKFDDASEDLHYGTLIRSKVLDLEGNVLNKDRYTSIPRKKSQLNEEDLKRYYESLDDELMYEARNAIRRRQGRTKGRPDDPAIRDDERPIQFRTENRASRAIEQEFWLSDEIMDMGIVDTEVFNVLKSYERTMGAVIARQETMTNIFGEPVRFEDVIEVLRDSARKMSDTDITKGDIIAAIDSLENMGKRVVGHRSKKATGLEKIIQPALDIASTAIRQGVIIPMSTEAAVVGLPALIRPSEAKLLIKHLRETFNITKVREDLASLGYAIDYERHTDRFTGTSPFDPSNGFGKGARWIKNHSTVWFGEEAFTNRLRRFSTSAFYMRTGKKLMSVVDRLDKLDVKLDPTDSKSLKAAARGAGFGGDAAFARDVRRLGLSTKRSREAIKRFKEIDPDSLSHPTNATKIAMGETDVELQRNMLEVADAIGILARERTDRFVVKSSSGTSFMANDALGNALLQFLTYPTSWFNAFLKRGVQGPNSHLAGYMGAYILGEISASILRDIAYRGKNPDDILKEWDEDFYKKAGRIVQRIPIAGPWTDFAVSPVVSLITGEKPRINLASTPAGSFAEKTMGGSVSILRKIADGKPVNVQEVKNTLRMVPILGSPPAQFITGEVFKDK